MKKAIHAVFSGMVQGVGFRFTARMIANQYKINGSVANLPDGRVELIAQGSSSSVDNFLDDLKQKLIKYIIDIQVEDISFSDKYKDFQIKFG